MKKFWRAFILTFLMIFVLSHVSLAEDLNKMTDRFYVGLADIIEANMDDPDRCLREVDGYYQDNQVLIKKIRIETKKVFEQMAPMTEKYMDEMDKYGSMSEEELEALEERAKTEGRPGSRMSQEATRYTKALESFMEKHPQQGVKIGMRTLELLPSSDAEY